MCGAGEKRDGGCILIQKKKDINPRNRIDDISAINRDNKTRCRAKKDRQAKNANRRRDHTVTTRPEKTGIGDSNTDSPPALQYGHNTLNNKMNYIQDLEEEHN